LDWRKIETSAAVRSRRDGETDDAAEALGDSLTHLHRNRRIISFPRGQPAQIWVRFEGVRHPHRLRIVCEVEPVAGVDLDNLTGEPGLTGADRASRIEGCRYL
jgi:hypothetical protein